MDNEPINNIIEQKHTLKDRLKEIFSPKKIVGLSVVTVFLLVLIIGNNYFVIKKSLSNVTENATGWEWIGGGSVSALTGETDPIFIAWNRSYNDLTEHPENLSQFADNLGDRGYTSLSNFTNNMNFTNTTCTDGVNGTSPYIITTEWRGGNFTINWSNGNQTISPNLTGLAGPQGNPGINGSQGPPGTNGTNAYNITNNITTTFNYTDYFDQEEFNTTGSPTFANITVAGLVICKNSTDAVIMTVNATRATEFCST